VLKIEVDSIEIHRVDSVGVNTTPYAIHRHGYEMQESEF